MPAIRAYRSPHIDGNIIYEFDDGSKHVRSGGDRSWRCNVSAGAFAVRHGSIGSEGRPRGQRNNAIFPDYDTGKSAMLALLSSSGYSELSINSRIDKWLGPKAKGQLAQYQAYVHNHAFDDQGNKINMKREIDTLSAAELESVRAAMEAYEGYGPGKETTMKQIEATKSVNDANYTDFKVAGRWISLADAITMVNNDELDAVVSGNFLRPSPGQPAFSDIAVEPSDEEEGEDPKRKDSDD